MRLYYVVSPEYSSGGGAYEPPEWGADCILIEADTKRDAIILGVREIMRTQRRSWAKDNRDSDLPPWAGYRAVPEDELYE